VVKKAEDVDRKVRRAVRRRELPKMRGQKLIAEALAKGVISSTEADLLQKAEELRWDAIQVDDFSQEEYHQGNV
jgi:acyl-CoA dehydrogenase